MEADFTISQLTELLVQKIAKMILNLHADKLTSLHGQPVIEVQNF
jgi:hypothetical protein